MSNILLIGPKNCNDGWGSAWRSLVQAFRTTNHNIKLKNFYTTHISQEYPEFDDLCSTKLDKFDYVIQNVMPNQFCYDKEFGKNIGWFPVENWGWNNNWHQPIKMMDEIWTTCDYSKKCIEYSVQNLKKEIKVIPIPYDLSKFEQKYAKLPLQATQGRFMFYFIGEDIDRKNIDLVVKAFHLEFDRQENVGLLIKTNRVGVKPEIVFGELSNRIEKIKKDLNLYGGKDLYKSEIIITDRISEEEMCGIHQSCNCFLMPSSGEGWSIPALDAAGFKNWVIMTPTGSASYAADLIIKTEEDRVYSQYHPVADLMTGHEKWLKPNLISLMNCMRYTYNQHLKGIKPKIKDLSSLSYEEVGKKICQIL